MIKNFQFYDEDGILHDADMIFAFDYMDRKYIVYKLPDDESEEYDVMHVKEYDEKDGIPHLYQISDEDMKEIRKIINELVIKLKEQ